MEDSNREIWFEDDTEEDEAEVPEYDISSTPNDFNVMTLNSFIESGAVKIPSFQRNYVWDINRASKWIESLILGLPVPQLFLYEESRNKFLVVDGQQRLMSIYYFLNGRFPRKDQRDAIRKVFDDEGSLPEAVLQDSLYFQDFKLRLPSQSSDQKKQLHGLSYKMLGERKASLDLRPIRSVVIKQNIPENDDSSIYEIFNRLNTGGTNLMPQEIRACMYHSDFYETLRRLNNENEWRRFFKNPEPDLHMKDIEILLRGLAMLAEGDQYKTTMARFLNDYSKRSASNSKDENSYLSDLFIAFLFSCKELPDNVFFNKNTSKFNIALYEAVFAATCKPFFKAKSIPNIIVEKSKINELKDNEQFKEASSARTTNSANVRTRLAKAYEILE